MMVLETQQSAMTLHDLFGNRVPEEIACTTIADIASDSRRCQAGGLFLALRGARSHGLEHLGDALKRGVSAVAWESCEGVTPPDISGNAVCFEVPELGARVGGIAARFFGQPSVHMDVVGVTGTNGKTSCTHFLAQALEICGRSTGVIGTLGAGRAGALENLGLTTPEVVEVHRALAAIQDAGGDTVAMEVSSHALDQGRVDAVRFKAAVLTNLTRDHLDYHGTIEDYAAAKERLFHTADLGHAVINCDDPFGAQLADRLSGETGLQVVRVGSNLPSRGGKYVAIESLVARTTGLSLMVDSSWGSATIESTLWGQFNVENLALSLGLLLALGHSLADAAAALQQIQPPPGRMEVFTPSVSGLPAVIVDYAHTPDALEKALRATRAHTSGNIWCVFGCGGERDKGKRPQMGRIAEAAADSVVITDDNPRNEDGDEIVGDILAGMADTATVQRDRRSAITFAIEQAGEGDVVLVAGKGHEDYQLVAGERLPYSDRELVRSILGGRT